MWLPDLALKKKIKNKNKGFFTLRLGKQGGAYQRHALNLTSEVTGTTGATDRDYSKHVQKRVGIYLSPPRDTTWTLMEPELTSPAPLSAVGGSAQSPQPRVFQPRQGHPGPNSKVPFLSRAGPGWRRRVPGVRGQAVAVAEGHVREARGAPDWAAVRGAGWRRRRWGVGGVVAGRPGPAVLPRGGEWGA